MTHRIHAFWDWFVRNKKSIERIALGEQSAMQDLLDRLRRVHRGLTFEVGLTPAPGFHFIISADGRRELFDTVHRVIDLAPNLEGWRFTALRPRRELPIVAEIGGVHIDTESIWFSANPHEGLVDLTLHYEAFSDDPVFYAITFILLDAALGEHDTETKVGAVECAQVPPDPVRAGLLPLKELPGFVDAIGVGVM